MKKHILLSCAAAVLALSAVCAFSVAGAADGSSPIAENMEFETMRNISFGDMLSASDPDGDELSFELTTEPSKGSVALNSDGSFVYTPFDGKRGKDYFGYKVIDPEGNCSEEATVIIKILKNKSNIEYSDMAGNAAYYDAVKLAECGAYVGSQISGQYYFNPDEAVSRGEFLSMCLEALDEDIISGVMSTGFADDGEIPSWQKPYISTAVMCGVANGYNSETGIVFDANSEITYAQAAVIINRTLSLNDIDYVSADSAPAWACQDAANMTAYGVIDADCSFDMSLTRAEAAEMLAAAMELK